LKRAVDFLNRHPELPVENLALVGLGDDALPSLLATASDERIKQLACVNFYSSFLSQMIPAALPTREDLVRKWNVNANRLGRIQGEDFQIDLGSVIPNVLKHADIPELPRRVLYCQTRDRQTDHQKRFREVTAGASGNHWLTYEPEKTFTPEILLSWLER
jgi:hypothetical protein